MTLSLLALVIAGQSSSAPASSPASAEWSDSPPAVLLRAIEARASASTARLTWTESDQTYEHGHEVRVTCQATPHEVAYTRHLPNGHTVGVLASGGRVYNVDIQPDEDGAGQYGGICPDKVRIEDPRELGFGPGCTKASLSDGGYEYRVTSRTGGLILIQARHHNARSLVFATVIDKSKGFAPLEYYITRDDREISHAQFRLAFYGGYWFARECLYYDSRVAAGVVKRINVTSAEFNRPSHSPKLTLSDIGAKTGMSFQSHHSADAGDAIKHWAGDRLLPAREYGELLRAGKIDPAPEIKWLMLDFTDPYYRYTRAFAIKYRLTAEQRLAAKAAADDVRATNRSAPPEKIVDICEQHLAPRLRALLTSAQLRAVRNR